MCGIAGFVDLTGDRSRSANDRLAAAMGDEIQTRGPDAGAVWSDPEAGIWFSHRRLSILDLSEAGAQPMATPDGTGHICYNGEAYNAGDLRPELEAAGYRFRGHSDTEVVLYGCQLWGVAETARRLIGMFAFAYWDGRSRRLSLVRDRLGKKPIYWMRARRGLVFASEMRPMMLHPDFREEIDPSSVADLMRTHYVAAPHSIFAGVHKVPPGSILTFDPASGAVGTEAFWSLADAARSAAASPFAGTPEEAVDLVDGLIRDATRIRLISDVPFGAFLSGGIDSSVVVAMMTQCSAGETNTFSIGYAEDDYDESRDAERVAAHLGTRHTGFIVSPQDAMAAIPDMPRVFDEPFADASQVPTYLVSKLARGHVTVALTGDGGDEVFAGYNRHAAADGLLRKLGKVPRPLRAALAKTILAVSPDRWDSLLKAVPARVRPRSAGEKLHKLAPLLGLSEHDQYRRLTSHWADPAEIVAGAQTRPSVDLDGLDDFLRDPVARMRYMDILTYLPGDILTKVDRASMAVGLETRAPLLDHRLVELSFSIPTAIHLRQGRSKWVLRQVLERYVPRSLFERPKSGFGIPIGSWLRGPLRGWAEELLAPARLEALGLRPGPVRALWQQHLGGGVNAQYQIWPVLMLAAWREAYSGYGRRTARREHAAPALLSD